MEKSPPSPLLFSSDYADLRILVTYDGKPKTWEVSSTSMCQASPVWKMFISRLLSQTSEGLMEDISAQENVADCQEKGNQNSRKRNGKMSIAGAQSIEQNPADKRGRSWMSEDGGEAILNNKLHPDTQTSCHKLSATPEVLDDPLDFTDDLIDALLILLRIAHLQFDLVPSTLDKSMLAEVAILCDRYDCVKLVQPWLSSWIENTWGVITRSHKGWRDEGNIIRTNEMWLTISWVFDKPDIFAPLARLALEEVKITPDGKCLTALGEPFPDVLPPNIVDEILRIRLKTVGELLDIPYSHVHRLQTGDIRNCKHVQSSEQCNAMFFGSLLTSLSEGALWPEISSAGFYGSLRELKNTLRGLKVLSYEMKDGPYGLRHDPAYHEICLKNININNQILSVLYRMPETVRFLDKAGKDSDADDNEDGNQFGILWRNKTK